MTTNEQRLRGIIASIAHVDPDSFGPDDDLAITLGLDSLSCLRVVAAIEREFEVTVPDEELDRFPTLREMVSFVAGQNRTIAAAPSPTPECF